MQSAVIVLLDGLAYGMVLFIISVGLTVTMGLMRVINLAHGSFAMVGGYIAAVLVGSGVSFFIAAVAGTVAAGVLGGLAEITIFRRLYRKGELAQVLMTFGMVFVTIAALTWLFGTDIKRLEVPAALSGLVDLGFRSYPTYRLFLIGVGAVLAILLWYIIENSLYGARLRAAVDNPKMARAVGIDVNRLFTITFIGGCALAGFGGIIGADMLPLEPFYALRYLVPFLVIVAVGGHGSFKGSFVAAITLGVIDTAGKFLVPNVAPYLFFGLVFLLLLWRPNGIIPPKSAA